MSSEPSHDRVVLQRQLGAASRALLRPQTYVGAALESWYSLVHAAAYPTGLSPVDLVQPFLHAEAAAIDAPEHLAPALVARPVVLVHGYLHNRSAFIALTRALRRAGFARVHAFDYPQLSLGIDATAARLASQVARLRDVSDGERVAVVGHSMGGIIARAYLQDHGGADVVDTLVTIGSPHGGTHTARLGVGPAAAEMAVGSTFMRRLARGVRRDGVRYVSYYSDLDACVVPAVSAKLVHPELDVTNVRVADTGHLSMLLSAPVITSVVSHLSDPARLRAGSDGARHM